MESGVHGSILSCRPVAGDRGVDVSETDSFGGGFEFCAALRAFALDEEAGLVKRGEDAADHDGAGVEGFGERGRGLHGFRREREEGEYADAQTEAAVLRHVGKITIRGVWDS